jgi:(1->4)-alpha-D-glucan 1-alpha-D-glucosylmutase
MRFQQLTGPVMAKAVEDTAFYRYNRLLALNEVGADPSRFGTAVDQFHHDNLERLRSWPLAMLTTSTHDTKRGEDAAARIAVLTEMPVEWRRAVTRWSRTNERHRVQTDAGEAPSRRDEYTFYQALVGALPSGGVDAEFVARMVATMEKAVREAKEESSWVRPDPAYDAAVSRFVAGALGDRGFLADLHDFCERVATPGAVNGLARALLRLTSPGVPDTYQGSELWNHRFVDPDNRVPIDFERRRRMLAEIEGMDAAGLLERWADGSPKLAVTRAALTLRARRRELFLQGDYEPIDGGEHVVAFARTHGDDRIVVVVPRFSWRLTRGDRRWPVGDVWRDARLELGPGRWRNVVTGETLAGGDVRMADALATFPVALLEAT